MFGLAGFREDETRKPLLPSHRSVLSCSPGGYFYFGKRASEVPNSIKNHGFLVNPGLWMGVVLPLTKLANCDIVLRSVMRKKSADSTKIHLLPCFQAVWPLPSNSSFAMGRSRATRVHDQFK